MFFILFSALKWWLCDKLYLYQSLSWKVISISISAHWNKICFFLSLFVASTTRDFFRPLPHFGRRSLAIFCRHWEDLFWVWVSLVLPCPYNMNTSATSLRVRKSRHIVWMSLSGRCHCLRYVPNGMSYRPIGNTNYPYWPINVQGSPPMRMQGWDWWTAPLW